MPTLKKTFSKIFGYGGPAYCLEQLKNEVGEDYCNVTDSNGQTFINYACDRGNLSQEWEGLVIDLVDKGADPWTRYNGGNALDYLCWNGGPSSLVRLFLRSLYDSPPQEGAEEIKKKAIGVIEERVENLDTCSIDKNWNHDYKQHIYNLSILYGFDAEVVARLFSPDFVEIDPTTPNIPAEISSVMSVYLDRASVENINIAAPKDPLLRRNFTAAEMERRQIRGKKLMEIS